MKRVPCPTCGKQIEWSQKEKWRPFCSERCQLIDLGQWADERYSIPGEDCQPNAEDAVDIER